jgi:amidase
LCEPTNARIAWSPDLGRYEVEPEVISICEAAIEHFDARFVIDTAHPDLCEADLVFQNSRAFSFAAKYAREYEEHRDLLKDTVLWNIEKGLGLSGSDLRETEWARARLMTKMFEFFETHDYLICPTAQVKAFPIETDWVREINGRPMETYIDWMGLCYAITVSGCPSISVPAGFTEEGTPVGLQIVGRPRDDDGVLSLALAYQRQSRFTERRPPEPNEA